MPKVPKGYTRFVGGISDFERESLVPDAYAFGRSIDVRSDPQNLGILPRTLKESGSTIVDLPKWADTLPTNLDTYIYGDKGNLYKRTSTPMYSNLRTVPNSHGNGLVYFAGDDYLYYTSDSTIGRYGPLASSSPQFSDDFLGAQGGVPLNTNSLDLESTLSQYADRADTASLSIAGDLAIDVQIKPESLPTVGNTMTLVSKWDASGVLRSYRLDITGISGYFGDGSDGILIIASDTTNTPIDSVCTGASGSTALNASNALFAVGQDILIHQTQGAGAGISMRNTIQGYASGVITLGTPLNMTYSTGAQVLVLKQYTDVTVNAGVTWSAKAWDGSVGGILAFIANGTVTVNGTISASGKGFRGGVAGPNIAGQYDYVGGGTTQGNASIQSNVGLGGGGGAPLAVSSGSGNYYGGGGGGSHVTPGTDGSANPNFGGTTPGKGATQVLGTADLTTMDFGGGGGPSGEAIGGQGGGIVYAIATNLLVSGLISSNGANGSTATTVFSAGSGAGAAGSVLLQAQNATLGTSLISVSGGTGGATGSFNSGTGGNGGTGRIHLDYLFSQSGTSIPAINVTQNNALVSTNSYQLRLGISDDGTSSEFLTKIVALQTNIWQEAGVSWVAATSTATFYLNAISLGDSVGTKSLIHDNASRFAVGKNTSSAGIAANFYDGLIDEVRVFNTTRSAADFLAGSNSQIPVNTPGLVAYYKFNGDYTDATANTNTLTASGSPVFSTDVPYPSPTTRLDIDQSATATGDTYALKTTIGETSVDKLVFTPAKDPQKSIAVDINTVGTGDWTVTIHDSSNNVVATKTVANALLHTGLYEFVFDTPWRPLTNFTNDYHFHITSTVADGKIVASTNNNLSTATFVTYFNFLVSDVNYHPLARFANFWVVGNEKFIGKYDATLYDPNFIELTAGWKVRCFAYWNEYLAIGVWRGDHITDFDQGRIYFWDGIQPTYNFYIDIPEGGINAMFGSKGILNIWAGYQGDHLVYQGTASADKIKRIPKITQDKYVEVLPGAVTMWKALIRYGVAGNSDSTEIQKGVYTWGHQNLKYPEILTYDYPVSTGSLTGTTLKIGLVYAIAGRLLIGWQDNAAFGIDYVSGSNPVYPTARVEFLINDDDMIWKQKRADTIAAVFKPLLDGQTITLQQRIDDNTDWITNPDTVPTGDIISRMNVIAGTYNQIQVGMDLTTTLDQGPIVNGVILETDLEETAGITR